MSVVVVKRPPRVAAPVVVGEEVRVGAPPRVGDAAAGGGGVAGLPTAGMAVAAVVLVVAGPGVVARVVGGLLLAGAVGLGVRLALAARRGPAALDRARREYLGQLARARRRVRRAAQAQRAAALHQQPDPGQLWSVVAEGVRLWERRPGDADFARIRLGSGPRRPASVPVAPALDGPDAVGFEPLTAQALARFLQAYATLDGLPVAVGLRDFHRVAFCGDAAAVYRNVRAALAQLATWHSPDDLVVAVVADPGTAGHWQWTTWLPHTRHLGPPGGPDAGRLLFTDRAEADRALGALLAGRPPFRREGAPAAGRPHVVLVHDGGAAAAGPPVPVPPAGLDGVTLLEVRPGPAPARSSGALLVRLEPDALTVDMGGLGVLHGRPDQLSGPEIEALARRLAPLRLAAD